MQWWYVKEGERTGPIEEEDLSAMAKSGQLDPEDLVWNSGMGQDWKKAKELPQFSQEAVDIASVPAPAPTEPVSPRSEWSGPEEPVKASVIAPFEGAWDGTKKVLFSPFDIGKWFALGFTAWIASLLGGGGGSGNYRQAGNLGDSFDSAREQIGSVAPWIWGVTIAVGVIFFAIGITLMWVQSRGKFMFLDNVVHNRSEIKKPWKEFKAHGNSLFKWHICYSIVVWLISLVFVGIFLLGLWSAGWNMNAMINSQGAVLVTAGIAVFVLFVVNAYIMRFLEDGVIPAMYKNDMTVTEAWSHFGKIYRANRWRFLWYGFFWVLLGIGLVITMLLVMVCTCCVWGCLSMIPYIASVAFLPLIVFARLYGLHYISQYGPDFDVVTGAECNMFEPEDL
jgi:hypothetical protein